MAKTVEVEVNPKKAFDESSFKNLKLESLIESRRNPRHNFEAGSMADLVESIRRFGMLTPLIVRPVGNDGKHEILAGARRSRAAKEAGLVTVPCRIVEVENDTALEVVVVENLQRKDIHPLEEADGFAEILEISNNDVDGLCAKIGKKPTYVQKRLSLLKLVEKGKKLFLAGKIGEPVAMQVSRLSKEDQKDALEYIEQDDPSHQALRVWIESELMRDLSKASFSKTDAQLVPKAGSCETCPKRTGTSKDLFDDIKQGDRCIDGACFKTKMRAHIDQLQKSLTAAGHKVYGLLESYHDQKVPEGTLKVGQWMEIKKKDFCEKAAKGIFLEFTRAGQYADICYDREHCKIHGSVGLHGKTPTEREKTRKDNLRNRIEKESRARALRQVFEEQGLLQLDELKKLCLHSLDRLWHQAKIALVKTIGWELKKSKYGSFEFDNVEKRIMAFTSARDAAKFMAAVVCANDLDPRNSCENLEHFASENKIDMKAIRSEVQVALEKKSNKVPKAMKSGVKKAKPKAAKPGAKPPAEQPAAQASGEEE